MNVPERREEPSDTAEEHSAGPTESLRSRALVANTFVLGLSLVVVAGVLVWVFSGGGSGSRESESASAPPSPADAIVAFDPFEYDEGRLQAEWDAERESATLTIGEQEQAVLDEFFTMNQQASANGLDYTQLEALNDHMIVTVSRYITSRGLGAFKALGWVAEERFHDALTEVATRARAEGVPPWELLASDSAEAQEWRASLGNFYELARRTGLVDETGRLRYDSPLLTVLFRFRWFGFAQDFANLSLMTPYERIVLWRWRIEAAEGIPLAQRLAMVDEVENVYRAELHPDAVRGILCYREGDYVRARGYFRRAQRQDPDDERYQRYIELTSERLSQAP